MSLLKQKAFRRLMLGKAASMLGSNMQQFALSLYVLAMTGSATIFASMLAIATLPRLLLSPVAGVFGDWFDRKKVIVRLDLLNGILIGAYAVYFFINGELSLISIYALVILLEISEIFFGSAMGAVIPCIVEKEALFEANKTKAVILNLANMLSPLLAAALYASLGMQVLLIVNAISFVLSAISEMTIVIPAHHKTPEKLDLTQFKKDLMDGIHVVRSHKMLLNIIGLGVFLNFSLSPLFSVALIFVLLDVLAATEVQYGIITTIMASGMLLGPVLLGKQASKVPVGRLVILTFLIISGIILMMALITTPWLLAQFSTNLIPIIAITSLVFLISVMTTLTNIALGTLFDTLVPKAYLGRAGSFLNLCLMAAIPLGQMLMGLSLDVMMPSVAITIVGLIVLLATWYFRKPFMNATPDTATVEIAS